MASPSQDGKAYQSLGSRQRTLIRRKSFAHQGEWGARSLSQPMHIVQNGPHPQDAGNVQGERDTTAHIVQLQNPDRQSKLRETLVIPVEAFALAAQQRLALCFKNKYGQTGNFSCSLAYNRVALQSNFIHLSGSLHSLLETWWEVPWLSLQVPKKVKPTEAIPLYSAGLLLTVETSLASGAHFSQGGFSAS